MNPNLLVLLFSLACMLASPIIWIKALPDDKATCLFFCGGTILLIGVLVGLPLYGINHLVLSGLLRQAEPTYNDAAIEERETRPDWSFEILEPPLPIIWPYPIVHRGESNDHLLAKNTEEQIFKTASLGHPGCVTLSFFVSLAIYAVILRFIIALEVTTDK